MYDAALWKYCSVTAFRKFRAANNKCVNKLFGYARCDSMSGVFLELCLPTADTIAHNSHVLFCKSLLVVMQSGLSVIHKHCCVVILVSVVFLMLACFSMFLAYGFFTV